MTASNIYFIVSYNTKKTVAKLLIINRRFFFYGHKSVTTHKHLNNNNNNDDSSNLKCCEFEFPETVFVHAEQTLSDVKTWINQ